MSKSNDEEEEDSLPPNQNTKPSSSLQRPPLLTKSKALTELRATTTTTGPGGAETNPLFSTVRRINTLTTSASASSRPSDHPLRVSVSSSIGLDQSSSASYFSYPNRTRVHVEPRSTNPNPDRPIVVVGDVKSAASPENHQIAARNDINSRDSDSETDKLMVSQSSSASQASSVSQLAARRTREFNQSFILYLLSFTCILSVPYAAYLQNRVAKLQEEKSNLCCLCGDKHICNGSIPHFGNANSRTVALYTVVFTIFMPFMFYKYLDRLPPIKRLSKSTKISKEEVPLKKRVAYMVDVCFSIYPYAKLLALLFATIFLIGFGGLALYAVSESSLTEALWLAWTFVADAGNHADRVGTGPRIVSVSISAGGMLIFAMILGLVSDAISEKVDSLRKGKSEVIERDHILILGWGEKLGSLLKQLAIANKSIGGGVVVVLAERDKEEMEIDIGKLEFDFMGTSVICRSGSPLILADLKKVSVSKARAIIVLASHENADQSDARALRVVLSLTGVKEGLRGHVVVEMSDIDNEPLVKLVGGDLIETVVAHDVIGRLMIQCALQPGLAQIWEDILGFENAEFYIKRWPELDGLHFKDVLISFPDAVPCGIKVAAEGGKIDINPDDDYVLKEGDEVLVIAEDDDTYAPDHLPEVCRGFFPKIPDPPKYPEKILFCGWRRDIDDMIMVLETFLASGSQLWMFNEVPEKEREKKLTDGGLDVSRLENIKLVHREGNAVIRRHLENLPLETFDSILILADESLEDSVVQADSRSLATLLLIRDIQSKRLPHKDTKSNSLRFSGFSHSSWIRQMQQASDKSIIISEILDSRTRNLVSVSRISDYVLSNELVSMALAMVAEDKQINRVLEELFAEKGSEMCITPAEFYLFDQEELCFYDIMIRGRQRQEIVIGYRTANAECAIINPPQKSEPRKWAIDDVFVVISSGE
ncbi:ion channel DMI1-like isoform X2 [Quercus lobata]|uniref:RCK N-terminal domain-containing protein n=1 Tax=Quercus lobata TaxID=97700 RepID=A0A7N2L2Y2_QUELO|nr:ion channel DMI1-like isoform X2 [Quercus lobata]